MVGHKRVFCLREAHFIIAVLQVVKIENIFLGIKSSVSVWTGLEGQILSMPERDTNAPHASPCFYTWFKVHPSDFMRAFSSALAVHSILMHYLDVISSANIQVTLCIGLHHLISISWASALVNVLLICCFIYCNYLALPTIFFRCNLHNLLLQLISSYCITELVLTLFQSS